MSTRSETCVHHHFNIRSILRCTDVFELLAQNMPFKYRGPGQTKAKLALKVGSFFTIGFSIPFGIAYYQMCVLGSHSVVFSRVAAH